MANHFWLCPTKNKEIAYDCNKLNSFLEKELPQFKFVLTASGLENDLGKYNIHINDSNGEYITSLYLYKDGLYSQDDDFGLNEEEVKKEMINFADKESQDEGDKLISYLDECDLKRCIEGRHGGNWNDLKLIIRTIQYNFGAIWLDEGIYPEVILPPTDDPNTKSKSSKEGKIKKFIDWVKK